MKRISLALLAVTLAPFAAAAQMGGMGGMDHGQTGSMGQSGNLVTDAFKARVERQTKALVAAADAMPADKYSFSPTPEQRNFGALMAHVIQEDTLLCSKIGDMPAPAETKVSETDGKDKIVAALKASTDFCVDALGKTDDSKLGESLTLFGGRSAPRIAAMINLVADLSDHYSLAATELRMSGLKPPTAQGR